jgi:NAD(P)-dependent dehydrogenase (short-subunit alcohol dehydrogenase family)
MSKLQGKTAVITGGTTGIGLATAKLFVQEGAHVFITGRRQEELDEAVRAIGRNVTGVHGDVAKLSDLDRLYEIIGKKTRLEALPSTGRVSSLPTFGKLDRKNSSPRSRAEMPLP